MDHSSSPSMSSSQSGCSVPFPDFQYWDVLVPSRIDAIQRYQPDIFQMYRVLVIRDFPRLVSLLYPPLDCLSVSDRRLITDYAYSAIPYEVLDLLAHLPDKIRLRDRDCHVYVVAFVRHLGRRRVSWPLERSNLVSQFHLSFL